MKSPAAKHAERNNNAIIQACLKGNIAGIRSLLLSIAKQGIKFVNLTLNSSHKGVIFIKKAAKEVQDAGHKMKIIFDTPQPLLHAKTHVPKRRQRKNMPRKSKRRRKF